MESITAGPNHVLIISACLCVVCSSGNAQDRHLALMQKKKTGLSAQYSSQWPQALSNLGNYIGIGRGTHTQRRERDRESSLQNCMLQNNSEYCPLYMYAPRLLDTKGIMYYIHFWCHNHIYIFLIVYSTVLCCVWIFEDIQNNFFEIHDLFLWQDMILAGHSVRN